MLQSDLASAGIAMYESSFRRIVSEWRKVLYPALRPEEFIGQPEKIQEFCANMRALFECPSLSDRVLLQPIMDEIVSGSTAA